MCGNETERDFVLLRNLARKTFRNYVVSFLRQTMASPLAHSVCFLWMCIFAYMGRKLTTTKLLRSSRVVLFLSRVITAERMVWSLLTTFVDIRQV